MVSNVFAIYPYIGIHVDTIKLEIYFLSASDPSTVKAFLYHAIPPIV